MNMDAAGLQKEESQLNDQRTDIHGDAALAGEEEVEGPEEFGSEEDEEEEQINVNTTNDYGDVRRCKLVQES